MLANIIPVTIYVFINMSHVCLTLGNKFTERFSGKLAFAIQKVKKFA